MPGSCIRGGTWGASQINIFSEHGHVAYQIEGDDERNRIQVNLGQEKKYIRFSSTAALSSKSPHHRFF